MEGARGKSDWVYFHLHQATTSRVTTIYGVNSLNERVSKTDATTSRVYVYAGVGHLLGVYDGATGAAIEELAYLGERPVATVRSSTIYPIETDHLMAPLRVLDSTNTVLWSWEDREPFGASTPTTSGFTFNLRFPGQWLDSETGLVSNGFRDYDPVMGRYVEVDPLGLSQGLNMNAYSNSDPILYFDKNGLSGTLTIYSKRGYIYGSLFGHSWLSYQKDNGATHTYGTWGNNPVGLGNGLFKDIEADRGYKADEQLSVHINDKQENLFNALLRLHAREGDEAWTISRNCAYFSTDVFYRFTE